LRSARSRTLSRAATMMGPRPEVRPLATVRSHAAPEPRTRHFAALDHAVVVEVHAGETLAGLGRELLTRYAVVLVAAEVMDETAHAVINHLLAQRLEVGLVDRAVFGVVEHGKALLGGGHGFLERDDAVLVGIRVA